MSLARTLQTVTICICTRFISMSATGHLNCNFDNVKNYAIIRALALSRFETKIEKGSKQLRNGSCSKEKSYLSHIFKKQLIEFSTLIILYLPLGLNFK